MMTGKELGTASRINAQKEFGLDVLTRISYETEHPEDGKEHLQKVIIDSINEMLDEVCRKPEVPGKGRIEKHDIYEITVAANCTMMHMLLGVSAGSIGRAPYAPVFVKSKNLRAAEIGIQAGGFIVCHRYLLISVRILLRGHMSANSVSNRRMYCL